MSNANGAEVVQLVVHNFDELYNKLKDALQNVQSIGVETISVVIMKAMFIVEQTKEKGAVKKALVLRLIERLIDEWAPPGSAEQIKSVFNSVGPSIIEALVEADKTQFLKKANSWLKTLGSKCGKCCGNKTQ